MRLGAHQSIQGGLHRAVERAVADGGDAVQIFTKAPQSWKEPEISDQAVAHFAAARRDTGVGPVVVHDTYLINLCAERPDVRRRSVAALLAEARRCDRLGAELLVFHPGSAGKRDEGEALRLAAEAVAEVIDGSERVRLLVENTAGQGTSIGHRLEHLAEIIERAGGGDRLGACLDTCHAFAAGYDLAGEEGAARVIDEALAVLGEGRLAALHLNDSKKPLASRVDRHALIGAGEIGLEAFRTLVNDPRLAELPGILETPIPKGETYAAEIALLRSLVTPP